MPGARSSVLRAASVSEWPDDGRQILKAAIKLIGIVIVVMWACNAVAIADPQIVAQAKSDGQSAADWFHQAFTSAGPQPATQTPSPSAALPKPQPIVLTIDPTATPATVVAWRPEDCSWASATMSWDAQLDANAAANGTTAPAGYYATWGAHWTAAAAAVNAGPCAAQVRTLIGSNCTDPPSWFATAITTHQADEQKTPVSAGWDNLWIGNYTRLASLWASLQCTA